MSTGDNLSIDRNDHTRTLDRGGLDISNLNRTLSQILGSNLIAHAFLLRKCRSAGLRQRRGNEAKGDSPGVLKLLTTGDTWKTGHLTKRLLTRFGGNLD